MAVLIVVSVLQLGLQATAARRISADPEHVGQIEREVLRLSLRAALGGGRSAAAGRPGDQPAAAPRQPAAAGLLALCAIPLTYLGRPARRPAGRATLVAAGGALPRQRRPPAGRRHGADPLAPDGRLGHGGCPGRLGGPGRARRRSRCAGPATPGWSASTTGAARSPGRSSRARRRCSPSSRCRTPTSCSPATSSTSTTPACTPAGLILTKAVLFLPQFVVVVAFPSMSDRPRAPAGTGTRPDADPRPRDGRGAGLRVAARAGAGLRRRRRVRRDPRTTCGSSRSSAPCCRCSSCSSTPCSPARAPARSYLVWVAVLVVLAVGSQQSTVTGLLTVVVVIDAVLFAGAAADQPAPTRQPGPRFVSGLSGRPSGRLLTNRGQ